MTLEQRVKDVIKELKRCEGQNRCDATTSIQSRAWRIIAIADEQKRMRLVLKKMLNSHNSSLSQTNE